MFFNLMEIIGFILGIIIGISLGLLGSGGSVLAIPILVYLFYFPAEQATTYSLFIVGISALIGTIIQLKNNETDFKSMLIFGIPSVISVFLMRKFINPNLPKIWFEFQNFELSNNLAIMILFSILLIFSSLSMFKKDKEITSDQSKKNYFILVIIGSIVGIITGFLGVGGGFLIIPSLIIYAKIPMKKAVLSSLFIISLNSLIGFLGSENLKVLKWNFLLEFTLFSSVGIFVGIYLKGKISNEKLKPIFGLFILLTGIYIIFKEMILK